MRLISLELSQVGTFSKPVRIDHIGPGLNVLAGANELGKSTIFRGLKALFTEAHRTSKASIKDLRPYTGGAPRIDCAFELHGAGWRLQKQFLSAQKALLQRLDGSESHQGADAENRLAELLEGEGGPQRSLPLLWVDQESGFDLPDLNDGVRQSLGHLLTTQADSTAGVGPAQAVLLTIESELAQLVTDKTGKAKKNSAYGKLLAEHAEVFASLAAARQKAEAIEHRLSRLAELQKDVETLSSRETVARLKQEIAQQEKQLHEAREARRQFQQLSERVAFLESQRAQRITTLADHDAGLAELAALTSAMSSANDELSGIVLRSAELKGHIEQGGESVAATVQREQYLQARLEQLHRADQQAAQRDQLSQLIQRRERLSEILDEIARVDTDLAVLTWPEGTIADLRQASARLDQLRARTEAGAPRIRFAYEPGRDAGFAVDGKDIADGADILASAAVTIEIEGIGRIEIAPGGADVLNGLASETAEAEAELSKGLAAIGAADLADAEARDQHRIELRQRRQLLISERNGLAPAGFDLLSSEISQLMNATANSDDEDPQANKVTSTGGDDQLSSADEVAKALDAVRGERATAIKSVEVLKGELAVLDQRRAAIAAELRVRRTRHDELAAKFAKQSASEPLSEPRDELVAAVKAAEQDLNAVVRDRLAVEEAVLSTAAIAERESQLAANRTSLEQRGTRLAEVRQEMSHVEGMLARDFEDGGGDQVGALEGRLAELARRITETERHVEALRLLSTELGGEISRQRSEVSEPLTRRLTALAQRVWPDATIEMTPDMSVSGLARGGQPELATAVSSGTREQIAVLARLGYAGMLAVGNLAVPLILDDPLVFSDDSRLDALFEVLADAAKTHQIIVMTCHERAFQPLVQRYGATRLDLERAAALAA